MATARERTVNWIGDCIFLAEWEEKQKQKARDKAFKPKIWHIDPRYVAPEKIRTYIDQLEKIHDKRKSPSIWSDNKENRRLNTQLRYLRISLYPGHSCDLSRRVKTVTRMRNNLFLFDNDLFQLLKLPPPNPQHLWDKNHRLIMKVLASNFHDTEKLISL